MRQDAAAAVHPVLWCWCCRWQRPPGPAALASSSRLALLSPTLPACPPSHAPVQPAKAGGGFGVIHLLLVALLAFLVSTACLPSFGRERACQAAWGLAWPPLLSQQLHSSSGPARSLHSHPSVHLAPSVWSTVPRASCLPASTANPPTCLCASTPQVGHFANVSVPLLTDWLHSIVGKAAGGSAAGNTEL